MFLKMLMWEKGYCHPMLAPQLWFQFYFRICALPKWPHRARVFMGSSSHVLIRIYYSWNWENHNFCLRSVFVCLRNTHTHWVNHTWRDGHNYEILVVGFRLCVLIMCEKIHICVSQIFIFGDSLCSLDFVHHKKYFLYRGWDKGMKWTYYSLSFTHMKKTLKDKLSHVLLCW